MNTRAELSTFADPQLTFATIPSGISIPYVDIGSGEPLLFVHGSLCDYRFWDPQINALSSDFRCIAPSLSHYWPAADAAIQSDFTIENHVAELADFIVELGPAPVHVIGHSRGAAVAFMLAHNCPHLVKTLTLADPAGPLQLDQTGQASLPAAVIALRSKVADLIESGNVLDGLEMFVDSVSVPGSWRKSPERFRRMAIDNAKTLPLQFREELPAYSYGASLGIVSRTLLIDGQHSPHMYRNNVAKLAEWIGLAERETISGASHGMNVAKPAAFNRAIRSFIQSQNLELSLV
ncbi:alpha/beta hydrolase [Caballeronia calidae]|uniref:Alpha/beta hydrolase n=1 Tax=Caballeronia calidae TaxID=1777139 RepID=A0A158EDF2_9BURK|nr:alpha/beta hydrolase [Caballeronia calidae]SAL04426.1 alpha/beta hydrolase [Caballeronia calidae]